MGKHHSEKYDDEGLINASIYTDENVYQRELESVFGKCWLFLGHETQIPNKNDFISAYMGQDPVIVVRQSGDRIRAFLNQCRHRGARVCSHDQGNSSVHTCPYHGWAYSSKGDLVSIPLEKLAFAKSMDKKDYGLLEVPRVETYKGLVFGSWDSDSESLVDYLGEMAWFADSVLDRSSGGMEVIEGVYKWEIPCNWKLAAEQFCTDMYHVGITHAGTVASMNDISSMSGNPTVGDGRQFSSINGHGTGFFVGDGNNEIIKAVLGEKISDYYNNEGMADAIEHLGEPRAKGISASHTTIFPNLSFLGGINTLRVWHPRGPNKIEVWSYVLVPKTAPEEIKREYSKVLGRTFSASGVFEQDDGENWASIQGVVEGYVARGTKFNALMGSGYESLAHPDYPECFPKNMSSCFSEEAGRKFYIEWRRRLSQFGPVPAEESEA